MSEIPAGAISLLVFAALVYIGTPIMADNKGRSWKLWLTLTFVLPVASTLILMLLPAVQKPDEDLALDNEDETAQHRSHVSHRAAAKSKFERNSRDFPPPSKQQKKSYTEDFKKEVVSTMLSSGETLSSVAGMYEVSPTLVRNWKDKYGSEVLAGLNRKATTKKENKMSDNSDFDSDSAEAPTLIWHIDRAKFTFSDPSEYKEWKKEKKVFFEFSPSSADDGGEAVFVDPESSEDDFEIDEHRGTVKVKLEKDGPVITAWVAVSAEIVDGLDEEALNEWSNDQGGWSSCSIHLGDFDASIEEDDGGDWRFPGNEDG